MCVIGEPTEMKVVIAHKGKANVGVRVRGFEAHSSLAPRAVNAIAYAAELIVHLNRMAARIAGTGLRPRLRRSVHHRAHRRHIRRHADQYRSQGLQLRVRIPLPAAGRPAGPAARGDAYAPHRA